jgi:hypothetical protein
MKEIMHLNLEIPDDLAQRLGDAGGGDLSSRALEGFALEEYKAGRLTETKMQRLLGFGTRYKLDGFLKEHGIMVEDYTVDDLRREVSSLERLGF